MPTRWASWAELGVVHLLNPHLAGLVYHACAASSPARRSSPSRGERRPDANEKTGTPRAEENREGPTVAAVMGEVTATITAAVTVEPRAGSERRCFRLRERQCFRLRSSSEPSRRVFSVAAGASAAVRAVADVPSGTRVVLSGLRATGMNGKWATSEGPDANADGRVLVRPGDGAEFSVLPKSAFGSERTNRKRRGPKRRNETERDARRRTKRRGTGTREIHRRLRATSRDRS